MSESIQIKGDLILRRTRRSHERSDDGFRFVVRWMLENKKRQDDDEIADILLPRVAWNEAVGNFVADSFRLKIYREKRTPGSRQYFNRNTLDFEAVETDAHTIHVSPSLDAILRPETKLRPIKPAPLDGDGKPKPLFEWSSNEAVWCATPNVGARPIDPKTHTPVQDKNPKASDSSEMVGVSVDVPNRHSLSVRDLLFDSESSAARGQQFVLLRRRIADVIRKADFKTLLGTNASEIKPALENPIGFARELVMPMDEAAVDRLSIEIAARAVIRCSDALIRPVEIVTELYEETARLAELLGAAQPEDTKDIKDRLVENLVLAKCLEPKEAEGATDFLESLQFAVQYREATRQNLALSAVHGGTWLIYNYEDLKDDPNKLQRENDAPYGQIDGPDLVGLGYISPLIPEETVRGWASEKEWRIGIEIDADPIASIVVAESDMGPLTFGSSVSAGDDDSSMRIWAGDVKRNYTKWDCVRIPSTVLVKLTDRSVWSTSPIKPPTSAELFLDGVQLSLPPKQDLGMTDQADKGLVSYPTADTSVQILIERPDTDNEDAIGFNLYAEWLSEPPQDSIPKLGKLKKWLVNGRYSFLTDIYHASEATGERVLEPIFENLLINPPASPITPRPNFISDDTISSQFSMQSESVGPISEGDTPALDIYQLSPSLMERRVHQMDIRLGTLLPSVSEDKSWAGYEKTLIYHEVRWDPSGLVNSDLLAKDIPEEVNWRANADRYRFFVTSTDLFGQESEPKCVETRPEIFEQDQMMRFDGVYRPVSRMPIQGPPEGDVVGQHSVGERKVRELRYIEPTKETVGSLELKFNTALTNHVSTQTNPNTEEFMDSDDLLAEAVLFRKFVQADEVGRQDSTPQSLHEKCVGTGVDLTSCEWRTQVQLENSAGWGVHKCLLLKPPPAGHLWSALIKLEDREHGYQYKAAIRYRLADDARNNWFPDATKRKFHKFKKVEKTSTWEAEVVEIREIVTFSQIVTTNSVDALSALLIPAPVTGDTAEPAFVSALPVGAVAGVNRDRVLAKLLSHQFEDDTGRPAKSISWPKVGTDNTGRVWEKWDGRKFSVTAGQNASLEAARVRMAQTAYAPAWRPFFELLAFDFAEQGVAEHKGTKKTDGSDLEKLSQIIGLRGATRLKWLYQPISNDESKTQTASPQRFVEAAQFRIFQTRVPTTPHTIDGNFLCRLKLKETSDIGMTLVGPPVFRDKNVTELPSFYVVADEVSGKNFSVYATEDGGLEVVQEQRKLWKDFARDMGDISDVEFIAYSPQHVWTVPIGDIPDVRSNWLTYDYYLPVGGGQQETFHWTILPVSSVHKFGEVSNAITFQQNFPTSIAPKPVSNLRVDQATGADAAWYDAAKPELEAFYPSQFRDQGRDTLELLKSQPRIGLSWEAPGVARDTGLVVHKEARRLAPTIGTMDVNVSQGFWDAVKRIDITPPGEKLLVSDLSTINKWLEGAFNWEWRDAQVDEFWPPVPLDHERALKAEGIVLQNKDGPSRRGFLDYFHNVTALSEDASLEMLMEYDHEYRYSIASYTDLGSGEGRSRYLLSEPTPFSGFVKAPTPSWSLSFDEPKLELDGTLRSPKFAIAFSIEDNTGVAKRPEAKLKFMIKAARLIDGQLVGDEAPGHRVDLGKVVVLSQETSDQPGANTVLFDIGRILPEMNTSVDLEITAEMYLAINRDDDIRYPLDRLTLRKRVDVPAAAPTKGEFSIALNCKISLQ